MWIQIQRNHRNSIHIRMLFILPAYCLSHFSSKIASQSNFVQHFVPAEYFTQIIVTFDFSTQNSVPVNLRANFLSQSIILAKNLVPVEIYLCPRQNIAWYWCPSEIFFLHCSCETGCLQSIGFHFYKNRGKIVIGTLR